MLKQVQVQFGDRDVRSRPPRWRAGVVPSTARPRTSRRGPADRCSDKVPERGVREVENVAAAHLKNRLKLEFGRVVQVQPRFRPSVHWAAGAADDQTRGSVAATAAPTSVGESLSDRGDRQVTREHFGELQAGQRSRRHGREDLRPVHGFQRIGELLGCLVDREVGLGSCRAAGSRQRCPGRAAMRVALARAPAQVHHHTSVPRAEARGHAARPRCRGRPGPLRAARSRAWRS